MTTGEGIYICDGNTSSAAFVDSQGYTVTLVFTEENGQITLEVTMVAEVDIASSVGTTTITMTGTKN